MTRWMKANHETVAEPHNNRHRETPVCEVDPACEPEEESVYPRMQANLAYRGTYHGREHDLIDTCAKYNVPCVPVPAEPDVTVTVPKTGLCVVENGVVLDTAQNYTLTRITGSTWRLETAVQRQMPFFEVGKKYKMDGRDKWFTCSHIDKHPETGEDYAHGWFEERYPGDRPGALPTVFPGSLKEIHRHEFQEV